MLSSPLFHAQIFIIEYYQLAYLDALTLFLPLVAKMAKTSSIVCIWLWCGPYSAGIGIFLLILLEARYSLHGPVLSVSNYT